MSHSHTIHRLNAQTDDMAMRDLVRAVADGTTFSDARAAHRVPSVQSAPVQNAGSVHRLHNPHPGSGGSAALAHVSSSISVVAEEDRPPAYSSPSPVDLDAADQADAIEALFVELLMDPAFADDPPAADALERCNGNAPVSVQDFGRQLLAEPAIRGSNAVRAAVIAQMPPARAGEKPRSGDEMLLALLHDGVASNPAVKSILDARFAQPADTVANTAKALMTAFRFLPEARAVLTKLVRQAASEPMPRPAARSFSTASSNASSSSLSPAQDMPAAQIQPARTAPVALSRAISVQPLPEQPLPEQPPPPYEPAVSSPPPFALAADGTSVPRPISRQEYAAQCSATGSLKPSTEETHRDIITQIGALPERDRIEGFKLSLDYLKKPPKAMEEAAAALMTALFVQIRNCRSAHQPEAIRLGAKEANALVAVLPDASGLFTPLIEATAAIADLDDRNEAFEAVCEAIRSKEVHVSQGGGKLLMLQKLAAIQTRFPADRQQTVLGPLCRSVGRQLGMAVQLQSSSSVVRGLLKLFTTLIEKEFRKLDDDLKKQVWKAGLKEGLQKLPSHIKEPLVKLAVPDGYRKGWASALTMFEKA